MKQNFLFKNLFKFCFAVLVSVYYLAVPVLSFSGILNTKHNFSASAPSENVVRAQSETQVCIFCHTPHNANPSVPLWNHELSGVVNYTNYWKDTLQSYSSEAEAPPIDGFSKLCLSCHDGTIAIGMIVSGPEIKMAPSSHLTDGRLNQTATGYGYIGTDLSGGHPVSIIFNQTLRDLRRQNVPDAIQLNWPVVDRDVKLYPTQGGYGVQCPSCHDPHGTKAPASEAPLWRKDTYDAVCLVCHDISISDIWQY